MSKFQTLYNTLASQIAVQSDVVSEAGEVPQNGNQQTGPTSVQPQTPAPQEVKEPQADLTSEGKKFLVELALKALAIDPDNITATDKALFGQEVTTENADIILQRIQSIVDLYG